MDGLHLPVVASLEMAAVSVLALVAGQTAALVMVQAQAQAQAISVEQVVQAVALVREKVALR